MENEGKDRTFQASKEDVKSDESTKSQSKKSDLAKDKLAGLHFLKQSFRTLSVPKRSSSKIIVEKDKNEPTRFLGEGVTFKAKLIGILEVDDARGDRMCQDALYELKMAVRAAGEHKQRINIVIAVDGIRLRDEKTGDCLHHHPVHKISFIAQDVTDSRAFGYIFGSPDTTHRFFGIKTDKAASQVVMAMRDLFQAVYELKKREVEVARQSIEQHHSKFGSSMFLDSVPLSAKTISDSHESIVKTKPVVREDSSKNVKNKTQTSAVIADLMDLELELNSLQQGLSQMERLTPSDPFGPSQCAPKEDPFGDSFTPPPGITTPPPTKLPPPPASGDRRKVCSTSSAASQPELHWFDRETQDLFANDKNASAAETTHDKERKEESKAAESTSKELYDIFTDLDPLGTGRSKPYMDKKDFFQELKNPPKKQLKDLKGTDGDKIVFGNAEETEKLYDEHFRKYNSVDSDRRITLAEELAKSDPYFESANDPFETSFADFATFDKSDEKHRRSPHIYRRSPASLQEPPSSAPVPIASATHVNDLHPGSLFKPSTKSSATYKPLESAFPLLITSQSTDTFLHQRNKPKWSRTNDDPSKQKIIINLRKVLSSADDTDKENDDSPVMEEATILKNLDAMSPSQGGDLSSDSFESIPEPPPRPTTSPMAMQPPPLPPKKLLLPVTMKPPPRPTSDSNSHYDYIENYESFGSRQRLDNNTPIPPLPAPARKPKFNQDDTMSRHRPHYKQQQSTTSSECEYYLAPISKLQTTDHHQRRGDNREPQQRRVKPSLDITLSQLSNTNFEDLATMLRIPASALSRMTLKELTECLSRLSDAECQKLEWNMSSRVHRKNEDTSTPLKYCSLRGDSFDDPTSSSNSIADFKANFEDKFPTKPQQQTIDRYAVFRELIEQEGNNQPTEATARQTPRENGVEEVKEADEVDQQASTVVSNDDQSKVTSSDSNDTDKYAALRTIPEAVAAVCGSKSGDENTKELSDDKEDSASEVMLPAEDSEIGGAGVEQQPLPEKDPLEKLAESVGKMEIDTAAQQTAQSSDDARLRDDEQGVIGGETIEFGKNWAKFDTDLESAKERPQPQPRSKTPSWPVEVDDSNYDLPKVEENKAILKQYRYRKHRHPRSRHWRNDDVEEDDEDDDYGDDSEENWESSKRSLGSSWEESSWRENGWSDRDSLYDDAEGSPPAAPLREQKSQLRKQGYQRKFASPHKKASGGVDHHHHHHRQRSSEPQHSPWDEEEPPDWQPRKYRDDERNMHAPPWTSAADDFRGKRRGVDEPKADDELVLLKMMLGKKRLKVLEEQLFRHYQEQLSSDSSKKSSSYYHYGGKRDSDGEASSGGNKLRYSSSGPKFYTQRPKSADKARKSAYSGGAGGGGPHSRLTVDDAEKLFASKHYRRRPYSQDELSISEEERWAQRRSPLHRKPPSGSSTLRSRHQSQSSPFEDNFTATSTSAHLSYEPNDSLPEGVHHHQPPPPPHYHHHYKSKTLRYPSSGSVSSGAVTNATAAAPAAVTKKMADVGANRSPLELHPPNSSSSVYDFKSAGSGGGGRSSRESSQRQSPFEDDFALPDAAVPSKGGESVDGGGSGGGGGAGANVGSGKDTQVDDDVFFSSSGGPGESGYRNGRVGGGRGPGRGYVKRGHKMATSSGGGGKYYENVELRSKRAPPDSYYEKCAAKDKYKKYASGREGNGESPGGVLKSPSKKSGKKNSLGEDRFNDPFNDNVQHPQHRQQQHQQPPGGYESKTMPRVQQKVSKSKIMHQQQQQQQQCDSESDSAEASAPKWQDDFDFADQQQQHGRK